MNEKKHIKFNTIRELFLNLKTVNIIISLACTVQSSKCSNNLSLLLTNGWAMCTADKQFCWWSEFSSSFSSRTSRETSSWLTLGMTIINGTAGSRRFCFSSWYSLFLSFCHILSCISSKVFIVTWVMGQ